MPQRDKTGPEGDGPGTGRGMGGCGPGKRKGRGRGPGRGLGRRRRRRLASWLRENCVFASSLPEEEDNDEEDEG